ncbi:MAG: hypothetical protein ABIR37_00115 [Candidatus Saccharimonadales bacterium]
MSPLYFDTQKIELIALPEEVALIHPDSERIKPLAELLVAKEFPFTYGDFPRPSARKWDEEYTQKLGSIVAKELADHDPPAAFSRTTVTRLNIMGLFPARDYFDVHKHFGGLDAFKKLIGVDPILDTKNNKRNAQYNDLSSQELAELLIERYNELVELPGGERFEGPLIKPILKAMNLMNLAPGSEYFERRFGGIGVLNEHLGYPNVRKWDRHEYILYGAAVLRHNGAETLTYDNLTKLSAHKYGPDCKAIRARFNWYEFQTLAEEELQRQLTAEEKHRQDVLSYYDPLRQLLPHDEHVTYDEMAQHRALYLITTRYLNGQSPKLPGRIGSSCVQGTITMLLQKNPHLTLADIETEAVTMDIFDDLWPMNHPQRLPILANCKRK